MECNSASSVRSPNNAAAASSGIDASQHQHTARSMAYQHQHQQQQQPQDVEDQSPISVCSNASTTSSTSSAPQYSEDVRRNTTVTALDLLSRHDSGSSSTKTCEVDLGDEERDTFSPVSSITSPSDAADCIASTTVTSGGIRAAIVAANEVASSDLTVDNKIYDGSLPPIKMKLKVNNGSSNTKEEKQRHNEEIVIMETSSISSETGSWESVFPHATTSAGCDSGVAAINIPQLSATTQFCDVDLRNCCTEFLQNERKLQQFRVGKPKEKDKVTTDRVRDSDCNLNVLKEPDALVAMPYFRERTYSSGANVTANTSSLYTGISSASLLRDLEKRENALSTSGTSACFIDASSLRDEDEVLSYPSLDGQQSNEDLIDNHENEVNDDDEASSVKIEEPLTAEEMDESPTKKLETFHRAFAKCRVKSRDTPEEPPTLSPNVNSNSSSSSNSDSPQKAASAASASSANNLSDEEKLWKRELNTTQIPIPNACEVKESFGKDGGVGVQHQDIPHNQNHHHNHNHPFTAQEDATEASVSLAADLDSSDSSDNVKLRREQEHKPNSYIYQPHNIHHISIHPLGASPKFQMHCASGAAVATPHSTTHPAAASNTVHSDLSYTTDYSSSSPAPSLVWSDHEHRGRHHADDYDGHGLHRPSLLPDTPHNSIVHIEPVSSNTSSIHRDYTLSSSLSQQRDSGAYCSDATDSPIPMPRTPKRSKFDEANPIVSGGASIKDFNVKQCESPPIKRRTDTCPIVSGGFVSLDFEPTRPVSGGDDGDDNDDDAEVELRVKSKARKPIPGIASWVVDMSNCRPERRKSTSSTSSIEVGPVLTAVRERSDSTSSHKSGCGFYVSLNDMDKKPEDVEAKRMKSQMSKSYTSPRATGFFVDLSTSEYQENDEQPSADDANKEEPEKKNIFNMFIDIGGSGGDKKSATNGKREPYNLAQRLSSSISSAQRRSEDAMKSSASSTETLMAKSSNNFKTDSNSSETKSLDYQCNIEPPVTVAAIRRISQQQRAQNDASKRHSWGTNTTKDKDTHDYKRSISLTANGGDSGGESNNIGSNGAGLMSIIAKLPLISKTSSLSIDSSLSPYYDNTGSKSELSTCSYNSNRNSMSDGDREADDMPNVAYVAKTTKKRRRDVQINETFDKSSLASVTDGILSKDLSPASTTDTDDLTFQQDEELALREVAFQQQQQSQSPLSQIPSNRSSAIIMETIIETKEISSPKKNASSHTMETLHATIEKQKMLLETVNEHVEAADKSSFVKLSDMDKPVKFEMHSPEMSKSVGNNHRQINRLFRDESKTRPHSWSMTRSTGNSFLNITNSVDNLRSLSRLFPHFSKEFSNSLPNDMILDQMDYIQTDLSAESSMASSFSRSGMDESSISCRQPRRLGEDLLKMFLQEIATDMIVEVHGRRIKAHKCILRSRCQYFAAMLAGHGAQSVVSLPGYSYSAVHFALCHIYSGASHPPDGISLMELAALADLLGLEGLKEVTAHALKVNYCHNFHKPCSGCIDGILQVLPVALNHALDDLYRKCLRWTCRHYMKVWPTRQFAQMPADILGRCRQQIVAYLTSESVLDTVLDCDNLLTQLASYRWGGVCENLVRDILDAAYAYIADHFASLIASDAFLSLGHDRSCHIPRLEGVLLRTASSLTPDQACRSYQRITRLNTVLQAKVIQMPANLGELAKELQGLQEEDLDWDPEYIRLVSAILSAVEQCLIRQCSRAMRVTAWQRMDLDLRKKIQTLARLTEPMDLKRNKPVAKAFTFSGSTRNQDLYQVKLAIQAHSKRALAQETQSYKATQTQDVGNVQTTERGVQANHDLREGNSKILKSNSRAYVPQSYRATSQSVTVSERNSINTHRRTQSEAPMPTQNRLKHSNDTKPTEQATKTRMTAPRLADIRPRYLEPRKVSGGPVRSATSSSIPATKAKGLHISSSDSSRNSSPATRKKSSGTSVTKIGTKSTNMSLDNLSTLSRRGKNTTTFRKSSDNERLSDIGVDSLADSMKSSVITNKTVSHESLTNSAKRSRSNPHIIGNNKMTTLNKPAGGGDRIKINGNVKSAGRAATIGTKPPRHLQQPNIKSTGSSPSSINTTKSATSRLSSVSSTHSSRDLFKYRSISVPGQDSTNAVGQSSSGQRHSFLSAKSREILAKRAEKNRLQQQEQQQQNNIHNSSSADEKKINMNGQPTLRSASHTTASALASTALNRNSLPSNIPTRRPNTLHLKKTTNCSSNKPNTTNINNNKNKFISTTTITTTANTNGVYKGSTAAPHEVKQKIELLIDTNSPTNIAERIESKLERSSTFCKESSDLDLNELQIIEYSPLNPPPYVCNTAA